MSIENADLLLLKAATKSLAHHFKKAAAFHEAKATHHLKKAEAHLGAHEHHKAMMEDPAHEAHKEHHKAKAALHKTLHGLHEKMHKAHTVYSDHHKAMAEAHAAGDAKKLLEIAGLKEEDLTKTVSTTPTPTPAATPTPDPAAATTPTPTPSAATEDINTSIQKALDTKLTEAVNAAFERVLGSEEFGKKVDQAIAGKLLEKLGTSTVQTDIKTFPVPRAGSEKPNGAAPATKVDITGIEPELAELCKVD